MDVIFTKAKYSYYEINRLYSINKRVSSVKLIKKCLYRTETYWDTFQFIFFVASMLINKNLLNVNKNKHFIESKIESQLLK